MKLRRKLIMAVRPERHEHTLDICPKCGHTSRRGEGRLIDPLTQRAVCVRCGNEIGKDKP